MNKSRREKIKQIIVQLNSACDELTSVKDWEEMAYDNLPENFQESERGETMQENIECMDEAICKLDDAKDAITEAIELIEDL